MDYNLGEKWVGCLTQESEVPGSMPCHATYFDSRRAVVSYWRKYVHEVMVNRLGGLNLPRKSVVILTDRPNMTIIVYHGCKTTQQQQYRATLENLITVYSAASAPANKRAILLVTGKTQIRYAIMHM